MKMVRLLQNKSSLTLHGEAELRSEGLAQHDVVCLASVHRVVVLRLGEEHVGVLRSCSFGFLCFKRSLCYSRLIRINCYCNVYEGIKQWQ